MTALTSSASLSPQRARSAPVAAVRARETIGIVAPTVPAEPQLATLPAVPTLEVDLNAVAANVRTLAATTCGSIMAVVKADGFGHGAVPIAIAAVQAGATSLGVATIDEALALRTAGLDVPLLSWLNPVGADFATAVAHDIDLAVPTLAHLNAVAAAAHSIGRVARVHLHVDTGLHRDGAPRAEWADLSAAARQAERLGVATVAGAMSHLPCADRPGHPSTMAGRAALLDAVSVMRAAGLDPALVHLATTAATQHAPETHFDLSRIGAGLYGIGRGLRAALTLSAPIVSVSEVAAGDAVGYGQTWVASGPTRLGLVPLGYADGIPRVASGIAEVWVQGQRRPIVGTISMDQLVVDIGEVPVEAGTRVTIIGNGDAGEPTVFEWSRWSQTVPHEIMTGLGARITRVYRGLQ
ncbi:MAG TPA: alanine racemase [Candidatus Lumbricidophila sp.]|nr:alanine racemase [Candidatus Lumbricidophila sp.]